MNNPVSRRGFLKGSAVLGGGLVVAFVVPGAHRLPMAAENEGKVFAPNAFLRIAADNSVTVLLGHSEMGQGIWTGLTMLIAEELDADWSKIRVEHSPASAADYGMPGFGGMQITGGSTSTWMEFDRYRLAGATARQMLIEAAAQRFQRGAIDDSHRIGRGDRWRQTRDLRRAGGCRRAIAGAGSEIDHFKEAKDWKVIGKPTKRLDTPEKITGRAKFGMDVQFEGLMTAMVARPPVFGASVKSFEGAAALAVPGVHKVVQVPTGVAVIADHYWAAKLGRDALKLIGIWGITPTLSSEKLLASFRKLAATPGTSAESGRGCQGQFRQSREEN
jgi:isoquinoline 1-oxidoreductase beta subunit